MDKTTKRRFFIKSVSAGSLGLALLNFIPFKSVWGTKPIETKQIAPKIIVNQSAVKRNHKGDK